MKRVTFLLTLLILLWGWQLVWAEGGSLSGQVLNGTTDPARPLTGQPVVLYSLQENEKRLADTVSGANGEFAFTGLALDPQLRYVVTTDYAGVTYLSELATLSPTTPTLSLPLLVYETTESDTDIVIRPAHILLAFVDGQLRVQEILFVENQGNRTYIGQVDPTLDGKFATVRLSLPQGATELSFADAMVGNSMARTSDGVVSTNPLAPGRWSYVYSYAVPISGTTYVFAKPFSYPVYGLNLLVGDAQVRVESAQLDFRGTREAQGTRFQYWAQDFLDRHSTLVVSLSQWSQSGPAASGATATLASPSPLRWLVLGLIVVAVFLAVASPFWQERGESPGDTRTG